LKQEMLVILWTQTAYEKVSARAYTYTHTHTHTHTHTRTHKQALTHKQMHTHKARPMKAGPPQIIQVLGRLSASVDTTKQRGVPKHFCLPAQETFLDDTAWEVGRK
jgi:hypothetical protein